MRAIIILIILFVAFKLSAQSDISNANSLIKSIELTLKLDSINNERFNSGKLERSVYERIKEQITYSSNSLVVRLIEQKQSNIIIDSVYNRQLSYLSSLIKIDSNLFIKSITRNKVNYIIQNQYFTKLSNRGVLNGKVKLNHDKILLLFKKTHGHYSISQFNDSVVFVFIYKIRVNSNLFGGDELANQMASLAYSESFRKYFINHITNTIGFIPFNEEHVVEILNYVPNRKLKKQKFRRNYSVVYYDILYYQNK